MVVLKVELALEQQQEARQQVPFLEQQQLLAEQVAVAEHPLVLQDKKVAMLLQLLLHNLQ
jgi:hypothetical protein